MRHGPIAAIDLDFRVSLRAGQSGQFLHYDISSPSGIVHLDFREAQTQPFAGSLETYRSRVVQRLEKYQQRFHAADGLLLSSEVEAELRALGHELYEQLFPPAMRSLYRQWRDKVRTIQITSGEVWIPWELVRPYDHRISPPIDDDFLGARYEITRWTPTGVSPAPQIQVRRIACIEGGQGGPPLPFAGQEKRFVEDLAGACGAAIVSPPAATFENVLSTIEQGEVDFLHFVGHGEYASEEPQKSKIFLVDGTSLEAGRLHGSTLRQVWKRRPLVFFNACSTGRQGWALTGPSGWVEAWVGRGGAGAFLAPQWPVRDSLAFEFARMFYLALARGRTLGRAVRLARRWVRRKNRQDSTWLAFSVYGNPNAQVRFGAGAEAAEIQITAQDQPQTMVPGPRPSAASQKSAPTNAPPAPEIFVGRKDDLDLLKEKLGIGSDRERSPEVQVLTAVRGWPGVGKTSVAAALAHDPDVASHFEGVLWESMGRQPNLLQILAKWGKWLGRDDLRRAGRLKEALESLQGHLRERRMVLVLDDVWEVAHAAPLLGVCGLGSPLLVTTREAGVAHGLAIRQAAVHRLDVLDEEAALDLLSRLAPDVVQRHSAGCRRLVNELGRLPLALIVAGRRLQMDYFPGLGVDELLKELASGTAILRSEAPPDRVDLETLTLPTVDVLFQHSTDRLDPETRQRFRDLGGFEASPFGIDLLRSLWGVEDPLPTLRKLRDRGLLEPAGEGCFQIHPLLLRHAAAMPKDT
ncbi:MAG TPA: hypothetical protein DD490_07475 [Acidobacteria bacterium]|nr:hypothetical protein [Acidobacteriota bacterium]